MKIEEYFYRFLSTELFPIPFTAFYFSKDFFDRVLKIEAYLENTQILMMLVMIAPNPKIDIAMPSTQKVQLWMVLYLSISKWPQWLVFKSESDVKAAEVLSLRPSKSSNSSIAFKCLSVCEWKRTDCSKMRNKHLAWALLLGKRGLYCFALASFLRRLEALPCLLGCFLSFIKWRFHLTVVYTIGNNDWSRQFEQFSQL